MESAETLEKKIMASERTSNFLRTNMEKYAPIATPLSWAVVIGDTYFYLYCAARNSSSADFFLAWDLIMIPFALIYTAVLAGRYRSKPEEPKKYVKISGEE